MTILIGFQGKDRGSARVFPAKKRPHIPIANENGALALISISTRDVS
jgi:hypothetical protein